MRYGVGLSARGSFDTAWSPEWTIDLVLRIPLVCSILLAGAITGDFSICGSQMTGIGYCLAASGLWRRDNMFYCKYIICDLEAGQYFFIVSGSFVI